MIAEAFGFIQFPILPLVKKSGDQGVQLFRRNPKLCTPRDFDYSPYFEIIKYPFMDFSDHADYRLLPWHGKGILDSQEESMYVYPEGQTSDEPLPQGDIKDQEKLTADPESELAEIAKKKVKTKKVPFVPFTSPQSDADFYEGDAGGRPH
ncbi:MAG: hypothetical protein R3207_07620, partial [Oceanospirillum sp.]|nr:hypothetical protein [Oceanospirillum sp.]